MTLLRICGRSQEGVLGPGLEGEAAEPCGDAGNMGTLQEDQLVLKPRTINPIIVEMETSAFA